MYSTFRLIHGPAAASIAQILALVILPGCARAPISLPVPRLPKPALRATIGPWSVEGGLSGGKVNVRITGGEAEGITNREASKWPRAVTTASAARVLATAGRYIGTPYRYGGTTSAGGFDCSGFVQFVFGQHGLELPRTSRQQATVGALVSSQVNALQPGDLMFFAGGGTRVDHVAIYVGGGRIIHASAGSGSVRYDDLDTQRGQWFRRHHVTSRRVLADRGS